MSNPLDWVRLYRSENVGPATFFRLIERYGTPSRALEALPELAQRGGRKQFRVYPRDAAEKELEALRRLGARLLTAGDPGFPEALRVLEIAPLLTVQGEAALLTRPAVAMVGGRDASLNGRKIAHGLAGDLGRAGFVIVSGLARGIDTAAHQGALASGTVAVLAGGIDHVYPPENDRLHRQIADSGCLVSEMPPGMVPTAQHFPRRNRIVSGLSLGVVVIEAKLRSGSLITARFALEQGRELFAVPGSPLDPRSQGGNDLIRQGAVLAETADDIIAALGPPPRYIAPSPAVPAAPESDGTLSEAHKSVAALLTVTSVTVDEILRQCQLSPSTLSLVLLELELAGRLERHPDLSVSLRA